MKNPPSRALFASTVATRPCGWSYVHTYMAAQSSRALTPILTPRRVGVGTTHTTEASHASVTTSVKIRPRATRFFIYSGALNQSWLRHCPGFDALESSTATEKLGEVRLHDALERHGLRTHDASQAALFFMPLWEYTSWALGRCRGTTHRQRMAAAAEQLIASPHYQRHFGRDHIWGTTASTIDGANLNDRLEPVAPLLRWAVVGRYKHAFHQASTFDAGTIGGKCLIQLPFPSIASSAAVYTQWRPRKSLLFFAGAVDGVCCTGAQVRCAVAELWGMTHGRPEYADVVIRPSRRASGAPQPCLEKARLKYLSELPSAPAAEVVTPPSGGEGHATLAAAEWTRSIAKRTGAAFGSSVFCLAPAGDMCVSSRVNSALAAGCIPVLLCDEWVGAFQGEVVPYDDIVVRLDVETFVRDPMFAVRTLRAMAPQEVSQRQRLLATYRADTTWEADSSRVAGHFLNAAASQCLPAMAAAERVATCTANSAPAYIARGRWVAQNAILHRGFCRGTTPGDEGDCSAAGPQLRMGSWDLGNRSSIRTLGDCMQACRCCAACRFVSFSEHPEHVECSWYSDCNLRQLEQGGKGYVTVRVRHKRRGPSPTPQSAAKGILTDVMNSDAITDATAPDLGGTVSTRGVSRGMQWTRRDNESVARWLRAARRGHCGETRDEGSCSCGERGAFGLKPREAASWAAAARACMRLCRGCARCAYFSVSLRERDCSWYAGCELGNLRASSGSFRSGQLEGRMTHVSPVQPVAQPCIGPPTAPLTATELFQCKHGALPRWRAALRAAGAAPRLALVTYLTDLPHAKPWTLGLTAARQRLPLVLVGHGRRWSGFADK